MSKKAWFSFLLCHLFLFDVTLTSSIVKENPETKTPETTGAPTTNATVKQTSLHVTTTTQLPATGVIQDGKHENPDVPLSPRVSLEKPLPKKRGILDSLYQPGNFDETGYDGNEDAGPDGSFSTSKSDFEEKPFYKYGDAAFVADDGYFENEGRTKRTADVDELYNKPRGPEFEISVEELLSLLEFLESRAYDEDQESAKPYNDNTVGSIEADMRDGDVNRERNDYENLLMSYLSSLKKFPAGRRRRSSIYEHQRSNTPSYRRLIL